MMKFKNIYSVKKDKKNKLRKSRLTCQIYNLDHDIRIIPYKATKTKLESIVKKIFN